MPKTKRTKTAEPTASVEERLAAALKQKPIVEEHEAPVPSVATGDRVARGASDTIYEISYVSGSGLEVNLCLPGTNLERFRVPVGELKLIDRKARPLPPKEPEKPRIDVEGVHERLVVTQHDSVQQLSAAIANLKLARTSPLPQRPSSTSSV
jgi:hypothetical protein